MPKTLHIAICSTSYYEYDRRLQRIAQALLSEGYELTWVSRTQEGNKSPLKGITHHIINTKFKNGPLFYLEYNWRIYRALKQIKPDLINAIDLDAIPGCSAGKGPTQKLTFDAHEIYYEVPELINKPIKKSIWKAIARYYLPKIKHSYTVNHSLKLHHESLYNRSYTVVRNIGPVNQEPRLTFTNTKTLVYLGVLNVGRGIEIAIEAMRRRPDYKLILIGEGDLSQALREQAAGLANVEFKGYVKPDSINTILKTGSIGLNMLKAESLNYKLSLANKFFDYMHVGIPSINMKYPEYESIINKDKVGLMVTDYTTDALLEAITMMEDEMTYSELSQNAIRCRETYNWKVEKEKLLNLYRNIN